MNQKFVEKIERGEREHLKISGNIFFYYSDETFCYACFFPSFIYYILGPVQTSHFTCAEFSADEEKSICCSRSFALDLALVK